MYSNLRSDQKVTPDLALQMQDLWEGDMALTVAKNVPAGLHLYETLTGERLLLNTRWQMST